MSAHLRLRVAVENLDRNRNRTGAVAVDRNSEASVRLRSTAKLKLLRAFLIFANGYGQTSGCCVLTY